MKPIDFDAHYRAFARDWLRAHPAPKEEDAEEALNEMERAWLATPLEALGGQTPDQYFASLTDAAALVEMMYAYDRAGMEVPEPLYHRVSQLAPDCEEKLLDALEDESASPALRACALSLLTDAPSARKTKILARITAQGGEGDELAEIAANRLSDSSESPVDALLNRYDAASSPARDRILDVCCNFPGDSRVYEYMLARLVGEPERYARNAAALGKLGDPRALPTLEKLAALTELRYADYLEINNAILSLGGEPDESRTFYGDPDYERLREL